MPTFDLNFYITINANLIWVLEKYMYANLLTRCDDACVITPYLLIYDNAMAFNSVIWAEGLEKIVYYCVLFIIKIIW